MERLLARVAAFIGITRSISDFRIILTPELLRHAHSSIARNHRVCEVLFLARYIEKNGTGTLMMIRESKTSGLPEPQFEQHAAEFVTTIWRDWLTKKVLAGLSLNDRQRHAISFVKTNRQITNAQYQKLASATKKTASRDLEDLRLKKVFKKIGRTGRGTH